VTIGDLGNYVSSHIVKSIININDEWCTILMKDNLPDNIVTQLGVTLETEFKNINILLTIMLL